MWTRKDLTITPSLLLSRRGEVKLCSCAATSRFNAGRQYRPVGAASANSFGKCPVLGIRLAQRALEMPNDTGVKLFVDDGVWNHVSQTGEWKEFEIFAGAKQLVHQLQGVPEIDVVVPG